MSDRLIAIIITACLCWCLFLFCRGLFLAVMDGFSDICNYDKKRKRK